jgi:hypothetical protein
MGISPDESSFCCCNKIEVTKNDGKKDSAAPIAFVA